MMQISQDALDYAQSRQIVLPNEYYDEKNIEFRTATFSIAAIDNMNVLKAALASLAENLAEGNSFKEWQAKIKDLNILNNKNNKKTIYNTNMQSAYAVGRYKQIYGENSEAQYLIYDALLDARTRPTHGALDGVCLEATHSFWRTHLPPCGYNCRCKAVGATKAYLKRESIKVYDKPLNDLPKADDGFGYDKSLGTLQDALNRAFKQTQEAFKQAEQAFNKEAKQKLNIASIFEKFI